MECKGRLYSILFVGTGLVFAIFRRLSVNWVDCTCIMSWKQVVRRSKRSWCRTGFYWWTRKMSWSEDKPNWIYCKYVTQCSCSESIGLYIIPPSVDTVPFSFNVTFTRWKTIKRIAISIEALAYWKQMLNQHVDLKTFNNNGSLYLKNQYRKMAITRLESRGG